MYPKDQEVYVELMKRLEDIDAAIDRMKRAETADKIAQGSLKSVEKALKELRASLPPRDGDGLNRVSGALDKIALAVALQAEIAAKAEAKAAVKERVPSPQVTKAVDWIREATGYRPSTGPEPDTIFWIDPRSAAPGDTISLYSTSDISKVVEMRVGGITVAIVVDDDHVEFDVPDRLPDDVLRRGIAKIEVDVEVKPREVQRTAWKTELELALERR